MLRKNQPQQWNQVSLRKPIVTILYFALLGCLHCSYLMVNANPTVSTQETSRSSVIEQRSCLGLPLKQRTEGCMPSNQDPKKTVRHAKTKVDVRPKSTRGDLNVLDRPLQQCCTSPLTGFERDGFCHTGPHDRGRHVVCAVMSEAFLEYTKSRGNDLSTPAPQYRFPGLKVGDRWCLCALRWAEAERAGVAPKVDLEATHQHALQVVTLETLKRHSID